MKFTYIAIVACAFAVVFADQDDVVDKPDTILSKWFRNNEANFKKAVERLFKRFDVDGNGNIDHSDLEQFFDGASDEFKQQHQNTMQSVREQIMQLDENRDGKVTFDELEQGLADLASVNIKVDRSLCAKAKDVTATCKSEWTKSSPGPLFDVRRKLAETACSTGLSSLDSYKSEVCVLNAKNCKEAADCYVNPSSGIELPAPGLTLTKRDNSGLKFWFWTSIIIFGVVSTGSLILIPFYIIVLVASTRYINFDAPRPQRPYYG
jgi:hypothetical protein